MARLLARLAAGSYGSFAGRLLAVLRESARSQPEAAGSRDLVEPLTAHELELLALSTEKLSNAQIAERLYLCRNWRRGSRRGASPTGSGPDGEADAVPRHSCPRTDRGEA